MAEGDASRFSAVKMIECLARHEVAFVIVGGFAGVVHGSPRLTDDLDICPARDDANLDRLSAALAAMDATEWDPHKGEVVKRSWDADMLRRDREWLLVTRYGALDLLFEPAGTESYATLRRNAELIDLGGPTVAIASIEDMLRMKRGSPRSKDQQDVAILEKLREAKGRGPQTT